MDHLFVSQAISCTLIFRCVASCAQDDDELDFETSEDVDVTPTFDNMGYVIVHMQNFLMCIL